MANGNGNGGPSHLERVAQAVAAEVHAAVRAHPAYGQIIAALAERAIAALAAEAGIAI